MSDIRDKLKEHIENVPDFPEPGVIFRDISPLLKDKFSESIQALLELHDNTMLDQIDYFVGLDARGFIFASALAALAKKGFIMTRKGGKLPEPVVSKTFAIEYGEVTMDMKPGSGKVLIVDDVLATGGTLNAAAELCSKAGYQVMGFAVLIDLKFLNQFQWNGLKALSVIQYE